MILFTVSIMQLLLSISEKEHVELRILCRYKRCAFVLTGAKIVDNFICSCPLTVA